MATTWLPGFKFAPPKRHQAIRLLCACGLSLGGASLLGVPEPFWSVITVITVMQPNLSHTLSAGRDQVLATLLGAAAGLGLTGLHQLGLPTVPLFAAGLVPLACVTAMWPTMRLCCTTLVIVLLIPGQGDPFARPLFRVLDILLGVLACIAISVLIYPRENPKSSA